MKTTLLQKTGIREIGAGVWNLGPGRDPFGGPTRPDLPILQRLPLLAKAGITYVEFHDVELPFDQIPRAEICENTPIQAGSDWLASFSRYDYTRSAEGMTFELFFTSPHKKPFFHRQQEWTLLTLGQARESPG